MQTNCRITPVSIDSSERRLRLLLVVDSYFPGNGGTEAQAQLLAELLQQRGHEVLVLAPQLDRARPLHETIRGIAVVRLSYPKIPSLGALWLIVKFALWLWRRRSRFDGIHLHMAKNLAAGAGMVQPWMRGPVLVKVSGAWEFDGGVLDPSLRRRPLHLFLNRYIRRVAFMQAISERTRERLLAMSYDPERIRMIPNAVDVERFDKVPYPQVERTPQATVIYVGRLQPVKGLTILLQAWQTVMTLRDARLVLIGDGPMRDELAGMIEQLRLGASVAMPGHSTDVPSVLHRAQIYVQPSFQEGLPNSVLEAMTAGLPIVATRVSGNEDLVHDGVNGLLVPPRDSTALADALVRLIGDIPAARRMGLASREIIDAKYSSARVIRQLESLFLSAQHGEVAS